MTAQGPITLHVANINPIPAQFWHMIASLPDFLIIVVGPMMADGPMSDR